MIQSRWIGLVAAATLTAAACGSSSSGAPTAPSAINSGVGSAAKPPADAGRSQSAVGCTVDVGTTQNLLPALHELEGWLNQAITAAGTTVNCGQVRSLDAKLENVTRALDQTPPNFHAACGTSGALVNEVSALVSRGALSTPEFSPPFPGGPTNVLAAAQDLNGRWCAAARGELVGPRS